MPDTAGTELLEAGLPILVRKPTGSKPCAVLIIIHGWGANESDAYELVEFVDKQVMIVAPRGPGLVSDDPRGSYAWYERSQPGRIISGLVDKSLAGLAVTIDQLGEVSGLEINQEQIYIGGFSQGAAMSLLMAATFPNRIAGILPHSGFVTQAVADKFKAGVFKGKPAFVAHGKADNILPVSLGRETKQVLEAGAVKLTYQEYGFGHETNTASRQALAKWLHDQL